MNFQWTNMFTQDKHRGRRVEPQKIDNLNRKLIHVYTYKTRREKLRDRNLSCDAIVLSIWLRSWIDQF